ncbi:MAG: hypothetical protein GKR94_18600 [Gammaproteobacteria bacterium]|nr:hypothetical protein [Gammaproteobacteria bacterium]
MNPIGIIDSDRLAGIPKRYWARHEYCFHLHDLMVGLTREMARQEADHVQFDIESEEELELLNSGIHALDFLDVSGRGNLERRVVVDHVSMSLYGDMLT